MQGSLMCLVETLEFQNTQRSEAIFFWKNFVESLIATHISCNLMRIGPLVLVLVGPHSFFWPILICFGQNWLNLGLQQISLILVTNIDQKSEKLIRKMSGARWKNGPMTPKLWPWPILIILHDICVAIQDSTKFNQKSEKI